MTAQNKQTFTPGPWRVSGNGNMELRLIATCLVCDNEIPIKESFKGKLFCSVKCLKETIKECEKQNGKGTCGYDMSDVAKRALTTKKGQ